MSAKKTWKPKIDTPAPFNAVPNVLDKPAPTELQDPEEDTAPLQGTHDLSDEDSLEDVIAESYEDRPKTDEK